MSNQSEDPIVAEVRAARDRHAAMFNYDIHRIIEDIQQRQRASGRRYVRFPAKPVTERRVQPSTR
jgi:hypothetical protein